MMYATACDGVRIGYDILGTGRPLVMLHDFGQSSRFWCEHGYVKSCLTEGWQVLLIDLRSHGGSSKPSDATACAPINCSWDVIAVLDHAGIPRADILGYGFGGRTALCVAARASDRVHAVAAGGAHPFAERTSFSANGKWLEAPGWLSGERLRAPAHHIISVEGAPLSAAHDWPDISDAIARSGLPVLLFVGDKDPHFGLSTSCAEQCGARLIVLANHDYATTAETGMAEALPQILSFLDAPEKCTRQERLPLCRWSGSWP